MEVSAPVARLRAEIEKVIAGQQAVVEQVLAAMLADGHVLLEGPPGVAKTLLIRTLARTLQLEYARIQFTPDLMPSDVTGTSVFDPRTSEFKLRRGPIFTNVLLADEINRTPAKTQAALLEAMEERSCTLDGETHPLPVPFMVFATQNPIDFEGTYPLPEAQLDRFLMKVVVEYPSPEAELQVYQRHHAGFRPRELERLGVQPVLDAATLEQLRRTVQETTVEPKTMAYVLEIVRRTRDNRDLVYGASPRAGIALLAVGKAMARVRGRDFLTPDDVKTLALPVLRHRVLLRAETELEGATRDEIISEVVEGVPVPR
jgi:MoxR-like ATPase